MHEVAIVCYLKKQKTNTETKASHQYVEVRPVNFREPVSKKKDVLGAVSLISSQLSACLREPDLPISLLKSNLKAVLFFFEENKTLCNVVYIASCI